MMKSRRFGRYYILDNDHHVVSVDDVRTWGRWYEDISNRIVAKTQVTGECEVSTVFIGIDHRHFGDGPPLLFETLIFGGPAELDESGWRYSSWDDAEIGHEAAVKKVLAAMKKKAGVSHEQQETKTEC